MQIPFPDHEPNAQNREPEIALGYFWSNLIKQVTFPSDVVVDIHDADDRVRNPDHQPDNPVSLAGCFIAKTITDGPGNHADESGWLNSQSMTSYSGGWDTHRTKSLKSTREIEISHTVFDGVARRRRHQPTRLEESHPVESNMC